MGWPEEGSRDLGGVQTSIVDLALRRKRASTQTRVPDESREEIFGMAWGGGGASRRPCKEEERIGKNSTSRGCESQIFRPECFWEKTDNFMRATYAKDKNGAPRAYPKGVAAQWGRVDASFLNQKGKDLKLELGRNREWLE